MYYAWLAFCGVLMVGVVALGLICCMQEDPLEWYDRARI